jgi:malic enzyme
MTAPAPPEAARLARAAQPDAEALRLRALCGGTMQTLPRCPIRGFEDFAVWYTPGVAAPARAIAADPEAAWRLTGKANTIAIAILPRMDDWEVHVRVAVAAATEAQARGLACLARPAARVEADARRVMRAAREATAALAGAGVIPLVPAGTEAAPGQPES